MRVVVASTLFLLAILNCGCGTAGSDEVHREGASEGISAQSSAAQLALRALSGSVSLELTAGRNLVRMADVHISWTGDWALTGSEAGVATTESGKQMRVLPVGDHEVRIVVFSSNNTTPIGSGTLATLRFEGEGEGSVDIVPTPPMLAPREAEEGLAIGDPVPLTRD